LNLSYNWLKEYVDFELSPEALAEKLTFIGLEVERVSPVGDDWSIELEITSNRPDCLSILGIAREVAVSNRTEVSLPEYSVTPTGEETSKFTSVEIPDPDLCPRYTAQVIRGVEVGESPDWLKNRLEAIGIRPVNNVVDVTNYVTMELGQPLHAFDYDNLAQNRIVVRRSKGGESITAINGKSYVLSDEMLAICDANEPVAIAGVMGGLFSEVKNRTKNILLESAYFNPVSVRKTSRSLLLESAASYRFERGVDPEFVLPASLRAARLILEVAGGELAPNPVDVNCQKIQYGSASLRFSRIPRIIGYEVEPERVSEILSLLGLEIKEKNKESLSVNIPPRRSDISREIDLVEEVLRHEGIEKIQTTDVKVSDVRHDPKQEFLIRLRNLMQGFGFFELLTDSFVADNEMSATCFFEAKNSLKVMNSVTAEKPSLRRSLLPNMLEAYRSGLNAGEHEVGMFEASVVYLPREEKLPTEKHALTFLCPGCYMEAKGIIEALLDAVRAKDISFDKFEHTFFASDQAATIIAEGKNFGYLGTVSREVLEKFDIDKECAACELDIDFLYSLSRDRISFKPISRYPKVLRDMAVVVNEDVLWEHLKKNIQSSEIPYLNKIAFFDMYKGKQMGDGKKSIAFSLEFQSPERTLTGEEADNYVSKIVEHLSSNLGAVLRK